jgi:hypothetical protein
MAGVLAGAGGSGVLPRVSGGTLTSDSTYFYRTFTSSGTLTVTNGKLVCSVLAVAGGAGGGWGYYGGNAGGVAFGENENFTGNVTVTVGGGGAGAATQNTQGSSGSPSWVDNSLYVGQGRACSNAVSAETVGDQLSGNGYSTGGRFQWGYSTQEVYYNCCGDYCTCYSPYGWYTCYCCGNNCSYYQTNYAYFAGGGGGASGNGATPTSENDDPLGGPGLSYFGATYGVGGRSRGMTNAAAYTAPANTGNGGGNTRGHNNTTYAASAGGSGIIVFRYLKTAVAA